MFDWRCWTCAKINEATGEIITIHEMEYNGKGIFVCPVCGATRNISNETQTLIISREYEEGYLATRYLYHDSKFKQKYPDLEASFIEDDIDDLFNDEPYGKYLCEVYYCWYPCGDWSSDWDLTYDLLSCEPIEIGTTVLDIQGWVDVKRNPIPLEGCGYIEPLIGQFTYNGGAIDIKDYTKILWVLKGYKLKFGLKILDCPENRKKEEYSDIMLKLKNDIKPRIGAEIWHEGWVDIRVTPWKLADGTTFDDNITGLYNRWENGRWKGATNIAVYDHYLEHLRGYKLQATLEVINLPENRTPEETPSVGGR